MAEVKKNNKNTKKKVILIKKTIKLLLVLILFGVGDVFVFRYSLIDSIKKKNTISALENDKLRLSNDIKEAERKLFLIRTYMKVWNNEITEGQKQTNGIDVEMIKELFEKIAEKNYITDFKINFLLPEVITTSNMRETVDILGTEIKITFNCLTEYSFFYFLKSLEGNDIGFYVIEEFNIKKVKNIDRKLVEKLIEGELSHVFSVSLKLQWYGISGKNI
ncbi:MAG: hypothetical protein LBS34_00470 [Rickettsiales bacterium]|jgi:hypothetical protein|nr:hypothetical protein [Rickettsiales bacterium]